MNKKSKDSGKEMLLFHGCKTPQASESIMKHGFDISYARQGIYGIGLYFAINAQYSTHYSYKNGDGSISMFVARVLVGEPCYIDKLNKHTF